MPHIRQLEDMTHERVTSGGLTFGQLNLCLLPEKSQKVEVDFVQVHGE